MTKSLILMLFSFLLGALLNGCASSQLGRSAPDSQAYTGASSFEISYSLGEHGLHKLKGYSSQVSKAGPKLTAYLERSIIDERGISAESYAQFLAKVLSFAQRGQRGPSQEFNCRSPYSITVKIYGKTYTSHGCRSLNDDGSFGKLVREGEFLLYSKK